MRTKDQITKYSTQQPIPTSTNDSNIKPTPYTSVTNWNISPISWNSAATTMVVRFWKWWMRYEDGGESLENVVESGGSDGGLKGTWKAFGGNTRDLGSILEETGQDCNFTQRRLEELLTEGGDGVRIPCDAVWNCKRRHQNLATVSESSRPKETLEDSASQDKEDYSTCTRSIRYCFDHNSFIRTRILTIQ
ncbi:hypothetical protein Tco_1261929 [Tanacetum coccineum]